MTAGPWIQTYSGRPVPILRPAAGDIVWRDIAISLGRRARFNGHTLITYSVAQHSLLVAHVVDRAVSEPLFPGMVLRAVGAERLALAHDALRTAARDDDTRRRLVLAALLHDAHEAHLGDLLTPVAGALAWLAGGTDHVAALKTAHDAAICQAAGLPWPLPEGWRLVIHAADTILLATEKRDLLAEGPDWSTPLPEPAPFAVRPDTEHRATELFLARLRSLLPRGEVHG